LSEGQVLSGEIDFPVRYQFESLGLSKKGLARLIANGAKVLDIGCGSEARLVESLRQRGIVAYGIDPLIKNPKDFLIKQEVDPEHPILLPDGLCDLVIANEVGPLQLAFSNFRALAQVFDIFGVPGACDQQVAESQARAIIFEGLRVMRPTGRFVIYSCLDLLGGFNEELILNDYTINHQKVERTYFRAEIEEFKRKIATLGFKKETDMMDYRTVIRKKK